MKRFGKLLATGALAASLALYGPGCSKGNSRDISKRVKIVGNKFTLVAPGRLNRNLENSIATISIIAMKGRGRDPKCWVYSVEPKALEKHLKFTRDYQVTGLPIPLENAVRLKLIEWMAEKNGLRRRDVLALKSSKIGFEDIFRENYKPFLDADILKPHEIIGFKSEADARKFFGEIPNFLHTRADTLFARMEPYVFQARKWEGSK